MLFKKPLIQGSRNLVGNKDRRKLKQLIIDRFLCTESLVDDVILPRCSDVTVLSLRGSKAQIYISDGQPVLFDAMHGDIYPTLYTLIKLPSLLPFFIIHSQVSEFVMNGADLMIPGILSMSNIEEKLNGMPMKGRCMGICANGNDVPFAVGKCSMNEIGQNKGKALEVLHIFGDHLWGLGNKVVPNNGFTLKRIFPIDEIIETSEEQQLAAELDSCAIIDESTDNGLVNGRASTEDVVVDPDLLCDEIDEERPVDDSCNTLEQQIPESAQSPGPLTKQLPVGVIDAFMEFCLLQTLHKNIEDSVMPISISAVFSKMISHSGSIQRSKAFRDRLWQLNVSHEEFESAVTGVAEKLCDVKKSSHKKLSKFFQFYTKMKLLQSKEIRGEAVLISVNREFPMYKSYAVVSTKSTSNTSASNPAIGEESTQSKMLEILDFYQPVECSRIIFEIAEVVPSIQGRYYDAAQCREALLSYLQKAMPQLDKSSYSKGIVIEDKTLLRCIMSKSDRASWNDSNPCSYTFPEILNLFLSRQSVFHALVKAGFDLNTVEIKRGKISQIKIQTKVRAGTKSITTITEVSAFGIDEKSLAETLQKSLAASAAVFEIPGTANGKVKLYGVSVQGRCEKEVCEILRKQYGIAERFVKIL